MAKATPFINGDSAPVHGSFIIGPDRDGGLDLDGYRMNFRFKTQGDSPTTVETEVSGPSEMTLTFINASALGSAVDLEGLRIDGQPITAHISVVTIGSAQPHRVITYTLSAAHKPE